MKTGNRAMKVMRILTREKQEHIVPETAAATLGKLGGNARAESLTEERRKEIAKKGAAKRWEKNAE